jgi:O-antigen/teichoic acid export membrane protein
MMVMTQPAFHSAWKVVGLSATAQFFAGVFAVLVPGMYIAKEVHFSGLMQGLAAVVGVALSLLLIPAFGFVGAAVALMGSYAALAILQYSWNRYRGYLNVTYEWSRLTVFAFFFCAYAAAAVSERSVSLLREVGISVSLLAILIVTVHAQLNATERRAIRDYLRRFTGSDPVETAARA